MWRFNYFFGDTFSRVCKIFLHTVISWRVRNTETSTVLVIKRTQYFTGIDVNNFYYSSSNSSSEKGFVLASCKN